MTKEDAKKILYSIADDLGFTGVESYTCKDGDKMRDAIKTLEQEQRWIPVSERLPEDRDWYLGIFKEPDTGWINPLPFICDYVGSKTKATTKEHWILRGFTDRDECMDYYFNLECVAWQPLPEPYKAESEDNK